MKTKSIQQLEAEGYLIIALSPEELDGCDPEDIREALLENLSEAIDDNRPYDEELGNHIKHEVAQRASGFRVDADGAISAVAIIDLEGDEEDILLQGEEADAFVDEAHRLYNRCGNIGLDEAEEFVALPYVENLWN